MLTAMRTMYSFAMMEIFHSLEKKNDCYYCCSEDSERWLDPLKKGVLKWVEEEKKKTEVFLLKRFGFFELEEKESW